MKKKISELELYEIDYLVGMKELTTDRIWIEDKKVMFDMNGWPNYYSPTTNPSQAWSIIEREKINNKWLEKEKLWMSWMCDVKKIQSFSYGKNSLESAMKVYIDSVYGEEVEI